MASGSEDVPPRAWIFETSEGVGAGRERKGSEERY